MVDDVKNLETHGIIGFDGSAIRGLKLHPDGEYIIYPVGNKVCVQHWITKKMHFLSGHSNTISAVAISPKGSFIGSGQINHIGFKAAVKIWCFKRKMLLGSHELHKVRVESLTFTCNERFMISLGGRDDGSLVIWDTETNAAGGTAQAARLTTGDAMVLTRLNHRFLSFVTGGDSNLRIWNIRPESKNIEVVDVVMGKLRRFVRCIAVSFDDTYGMAGTTTGDIIKFSINYPADPKEPLDNCKPALLGCLAKCGPSVRKGKRPSTICYSQGIEAILIMEDGCLIVGAGDGTIEILDEITWGGPLPKSKVVDPNFPQFKALKTCKLDGCITSLQIMESPRLQGDKRLLLVGTKSSEIYAINVRTFQATLVVTCHKCAINDIAFPLGMSGVFATAGTGDVRVWCLETCQELLRIVVPNFTCSSVVFSADGKSIVTAWNDGNIRAFTPLTGRLIYCIYNTHNKGTSAIAMTRDGKTLVSGGCEGQVRVWDIKPISQSLKKVLKEHKSPVSAIEVHPNDTEAVSAGTDGSCIIWDLISLSRRQVMYANTLFMCVSFEPMGCQLLTGGTDRMVAYWETGSGNLARKLIASDTGAINGVHVSSDGSLYITGGNDQMVKLWKYQEGIYTHMGLGHAGAVTSCKFSADMRYVVSACAAGMLIVWRVPEHYIPKPPSRQESAKLAEKAPKKKKQQQPPEQGKPRKQGKPQKEGKPPKEELKLPLDKPPLGSGDRVNKLPAAPSKEEKIEAIDTTRSSVHSCCPCDTARSKTSDKPAASPKPGVQCCVPPKTNSGGGDRK